MSVNDIKKGRIGILLLDAGLLSFGLTAKALASAMIDAWPDCIFARYGITCPACGATRCVKALFSGHFGQAFRLHPFLFCLSFYLAAAALLLNVGYLLPQSHCQRIGKTMLSGKAILVLSIGYALFGTVRMLLMLPI